MATYIENEVAYDNAIKARIRDGATKKFLNVFVVAHDEIDWSYAFEIATNDADSFICKLLESGYNYGKMSERQLEVLAEAITRSKEYDVKKIARQQEWENAREAERQEIIANGGSAPLGRQVVTGQVVSLKDIESNWGITTKILVKDERGFKIWASAPIVKTAVEMTEEEFESTHRMNRYGLQIDSKGRVFKEEQVELNDVITFTATLEASDDETFVFAKRPTKCSFLARGVVYPEVN